MIKIEYLRMDSVSKLLTDFVSRDSVIESVLYAGKGELIVHSDLKSEAQEFAFTKWIEYLSVESEIAGKFPIGNFSVVVYRNYLQPSGDELKSSFEVV